MPAKAGIQYSLPLGLLDCRVKPGNDENLVTAPQSKQQRNGDSRKRYRPDPDADAVCPVLPALRLGEPLNSIVVEP